MPTLDVALADRSYSILIEPGSLARLGEITREHAPHDRAMLVVDTGVVEAHAPAARRSLAHSGYDLLVHELVAEEKRKTIDTVEAMYDAMLAAHFERGSPVVALGGGVVGDVAGFAAATFLRGVPLIQVPTTLLAMVDASIGGKTGVNFPRPADAAGQRVPAKNIVGAFWQPLAIVVDPCVLATLDDRDYRCGLAETVKHAVLGDADLLAFVEANAELIATRDEALLVELITRSAGVKVAIVEADEREAGCRMLLNLGHTFAHAIEPIAALDLRHGEAVSIGVCAAARCAVARGSLDADAATRIAELLAKLGLPTRVPGDEDAGRLVEAMTFDKKVSGGAIRLVLPTALGAADVVADVPRDAIAAAWRAVGAR